MDLISAKLNEGILLLEEANNEERRQKRLAKAAEGGPVKPVTFPPNMISMCKRRIVYHLLRLPVVLVTDPQLLRIFDNGHSVHERITKYFAAAGCLSAYDYKVYDEENRIGGYIDVILKFSDDEFNLIDEDPGVPGRPYMIGEIKSANSNACYWIERKSAPSKKYTEQLQLYMHITGIHKGVIIVERKDDQTIWPNETDNTNFYVDYNPELATDLINKVKYCLECADNKIIPKRDGTRKSSPCYSDGRPSCPYYDICWSETEGNDLIDMVRQAASLDEEAGQDD